MCNYFGSDIVFMAKRIGVFGGSFNPLHIGHLIVAEAAWKKGCEKIHFLRTPELEISSTILRKWIASNRSVKYMIPDSVIQYINIHNLYKDEE